MGFGGINMWQLLIILAIVVLLFGTKKLRNIGGDLGSAIKGFKKAVDNDDKSSSKSEETDKKIDVSESQAIDKNAEKQKENS